MRVLTLLKRRVVNMCDVFMFAVDYCLDPRDVLLTVDPRGRIVAYVGLRYVEPMPGRYTWDVYMHTQHVGRISKSEMSRWNASWINDSYMHEATWFELLRTFESFHDAKSALEEIYLRLVVDD